MTPNSMPVAVMRGVVLSAEDEALIFYGGVFAIAVNSLCRVSRRAVAALASPFHGQMTLSRKATAGSPSMARVTGYHTASQLYKVIMTTISGNRLAIMGISTVHAARSKRGTSGENSGAVSRARIATENMYCWYKAATACLTTICSRKPLIFRNTIRKSV